MFSSDRRYAPGCCTFIALGSNLGDKLQSLNMAITSISQLSGVQVVAISHCYQTKPWGPLAACQSPYLNMVIGIKECLEPVELLQQLQSIERKMGRYRQLVRPKWSSRIIDIDILLHRSFQVNQDDLVIPHRGLTERVFVLQPLADLIPTYCFPGSLYSIMTLLEKCRGKLGFDAFACRRYCSASMFKFALTKEYT